MVQTCMVHMIRAANMWVSYADRRQVSAALRDVYTAPNGDTASAALKAFAYSALGRKYPQSAKVWLDALEQLILFSRSLQLSGGCSTPRTRSSRSMPSYKNNPQQFPSDTAALKTR